MTTEAPPANLGDWPLILRQLAEVIGPDLTLVLADRVGGLDRVNIPRTTTTSHLWATVLPAAAWALVVERFGGERIDLPRGKIRAVVKTRIIELAEQGVPHRQIALQLKTTERHVRRCLQGLSMPKPSDSRQLSMFEGDKR